jgi:hypothetical protein
MAKPRPKAKVRTKVMKALPSDPMVQTKWGSFADLRDHSQTSQRGLRFACGALLTLLMGCSGEPFVSYSALDRLRILALIVDQPEIQDTGALALSVALTPVVSDVGGTDKVVLDIQSCLDPGVSLGAQPDCSGQPLANQLSVDVTEAPGQGPEVFGPLTRTGIPVGGAITVPFNVPPSLLAKLPATLQFNGVPFLIVVKASSGGRTVTAFRRVLLSNKTTVNTNPTLADLKESGGSLLTLPTSPVALSFSAGASPESYEFLRSDGVKIPLDEVFEVTWFISDGSVKTSRTRLGEELEWSPPSSPPASGRKVVVVGILRDGRGGVSYLIRNL